MLQRMAIAILTLALFGLMVVAAAPEEEGELLYVASQTAAAVSVIDMETRMIIQTIDLTELGFSSNAKPHHTVVEPDGKHWYVSLIGDGRVLKFDRANELVGEAPFEAPGMMALDPIQDVLYVGRSMAAVNPPQRIGVIERAGMEINEFDVFFPRPHAIVAHPGGGRVYTASLAVNQIASLVPAEDDLELLNVEGKTHTFVQFALSPDTKTLVVGGQISGLIMVFDLTKAKTPKLLHTFAVGGEPWHPVFSLDGATLYFPQRTGNAIAVIDTRSWEVIDSIEGEGIAEPHGSAISVDGSTLWISNRNTNGTYNPRPLGNDELPVGTVVAIDTESRRILEVLEVPAYAAGMGTRSRH